METPAVPPQDIKLLARDPKELREELVKSAGNDPFKGYLPDVHSPEIEAMFDKWLAPNVFVCQMKAERCSEFCGEQNRRCGSAYWRDHSRMVSRMMKRLAEDRKESDERRAVWEAAGLLHDLDYLKAPHDVVGSCKQESHPVPLVVSLKELNFPPILTLAILEHSPHLVLGTSSIMSAALIGCDEAATLSAFGEDISTIDGVPKCVTEAILEHRVLGHREILPLEGRHRPNIQTRMLGNFERMKAPTEPFVVQI